MILTRALVSFWNSSVLNRTQLTVGRAAFVAAPNDRRGNAGVGIIQGPGLQLWDLSVRKKFIFSENKNLELRGDFFNAFNRVNFRGLPTNLDDGAYSRLNSSGVARNIQFALRFTF